MARAAAGEAVVVDERDERSDLADVEREEARSLEKDPSATAAVLPSAPAGGCVRSHGWVTGPHRVRPSELPEEMAVMRPCPKGRAAPGVR